MRSRSLKLKVDGILVPAVPVGKIPHFGYLVLRGLT